MIRVHLESDHDNNPVFVGDAQSAAQFLRDMGAGHSVTIRHNGGLRSCMNKPELWAWLESRDKAIVAYRGTFINPRHGNPFNVPAIELLGLCGDWHNGKLYGPDVRDIAHCLPYRYRAAYLRRDFTLWQESHIQPNDSWHIMRMSNSRGRYMTAIRFEALREGQIA